MNVVLAILFSISLSIPVSSVDGHRFLTLRAPNQVLAGAGTESVQGVMTHTQKVSGQQEPELEAAREKFDQTKRTLERIRRLHETGSASAQDLRQAVYDQKIAKIEYWLVADPERKHDLILEAARLTLELRLAEFEVIRELRKNGSVPQLDYRRARTRLQIASVTYDSVRDYGDKKVLEFEIAKIQFDLAGHELATAQRLAATGAVSRSTLEKFEQYYRDRERSVEAARDSMNQGSRRLDF